VDGIIPQLNVLNMKGPNNTDDFVPVTIRNIQRKRVNVPFVSAGQSASFALKKVRRQDIRKGMVMLQKTDTPPRAVREFTAEGSSIYCIYLLTYSHDLVSSNDNQTKVSSDVTCQRNRSNLPNYFDYSYPQ
jgi:translation elongation factor EF-1alpha